MYFKSLSATQAEQVFLQYTTFHFYVRDHEGRIAMNQYIHKGKEQI